MQSVLSWFRGLFRKKKPPYNLITAREELERIRELLKPSSQATVNELLFVLYNFQEELPYSFVEDFSKLRDLRFTFNSKTSQKLSLLLSEAFDGSYERIIAHREVMGLGKTEKPVSNWYSNKESIETIMQAMSVWCQIGMRLHYERYQEGHPGLWDEPVSKGQENFVFSNAFMKVLSDYVEVIDLILSTQPRGIDLEQTKR
ncbi:hypothetical protein FDJ25_gp005 [Vibrio phage Aphrodite1]|uniref:Uncharacterized protein n=1 Tax=Vibrio phage Aphrodite1 TaxID=2070057 RepID=A0A2I7QI10_9CAUD|nr:hypothetical protein FDJ25_gp005 [Vibrio phage Aphrodite1]AUR81029.1 hypothetical protein Aphrodite1_0205 [Vibrio phage Aphrodite1]